MSDLISKKRILDAVKPLFRLVGNGDNPLSIVYNRGLNDVLDAIRRIPEVDIVEVVRHGRWLDMQEDDATEGMWRCSVCGSDHYFYIITPTECGCYYCPNCGAKMDGEK